MHPGVETIWVHLLLIMTLPEFSKMALQAITYNVDETSVAKTKSHALRPC
jgi:hypothetical protein